MLLAALWQPSLVEASDATEVEVWGEAMIVDADLARARREAMQSALQNAVAQVVGVRVTSEFSDKQQERTVGKRQQFDSDVRSLVTAQARGFISSHKILKEVQHEGTLRLWVRASVHGSKLDAELSRLKAKLVAAGRPKLWVHIVETHKDSAGQLKKVPSRLSTKLEAALVKRGFVVVAKASNAQMTLRGTLQIADLGPMQAQAGLAGLEGMVKVRLDGRFEVVRLSDGRVLATEAVQMSSLGASAERALNRALEGKGANYVRRVLKKLAPQLGASLTPPR